MNGTRLQRGPLSQSRMGVNPPKGVKGQLNMCKKKLEKGTSNQSRPQDRHTDDSPDKVTQGNSAITMPLLQRESDLEERPTRVWYAAWPSTETPCGSKPRSSASLPAAGVEQRRPRQTECIQGPTDTKIAFKAGVP